MRFKMKRSKFKIILIILGLIILSVWYFADNPQKAQAAVPYPVPHRSWIKLGIVAYQGSMTPEQLDWTAKNIDWFDSPGPSFLSQYKAKTDAPMIVYDNYYCLYVGGGKYNAMVSYVNAHGLNLEDMFVHFDVDTTITFSGETHTLPAGSRVPTYGWYGTGGDLTKNNARVIMNVNNPDYRVFNAEYELSLVNAQHSGVSYDGIFVDNSAPGVLTATGIISSGGTYAEYPGKTREEARTAYDADMVLTFAAVRSAFGPKGAADSKLQVPNSSYDNWTAIFPYIDGVFREFMIQPRNANVESVNSYIRKIAEADAAGVPSIISSVGLGSTNTDNPREKMTALALYYLAASNMDYFCRQDKNSGDPQVWGWFGALDYNVGQPKGDQSTFARGVDPSSPKRDSGIGIVTSSGASYTLTDTSKNWPNEYWQGTSLIDQNCNTFPVWHSGSNWISFWRASAPYPISGAYQIGTYIYKVYHREYDNVVVLVKPKPSWAVTELGDPSATTHILPATADNPWGRYLKLNADGTIDSTPITQITLRNAEGAILIKVDLIPDTEPPTKPPTIEEEEFASDLSRVKAYPNPYRGDKHSQIIFDNLTANIKIRIYTLKGELVREIKEQEGDRAYWDVRNKQGGRVSSGTYIYYITDPQGQEKRGKIAIIK